MNVLKPVISVLFLMVYLLGFAHAIVPHCHEPGAETHHHTHHKDDSHSHKHEHQHSDHEHISHGDHYDHSWFDLFVCIFSNFEHQGEEDCHAPHFIQENDIRQKTNSFGNHKAILFYQLSERLPEDPETLLNKANAPPEIQYDSLFSDNSPLRGPPVFSC